MCTSHLVTLSLKFLLSILLYSFSAPIFFCHILMVLFNLWVQDDTCWRALKSRRLCFWRIKFGKCFGVCFYILLYVILKTICGVIFFHCFCLVTLHNMIYLRSAGFSWLLPLSKPLIGNLSFTCLVSSVLAGKSHRLLTNHLHTVVV